MVEWYSRHRDDQSVLAEYLIYGNGRMILEGIMNWIPLRLKTDNKNAPCQVIGGAFFM